MTHLSRISPTPGRIALVGAGPGAADLLTIRALRALEQADVVLYDRLVTTEILALIPVTTRRIAVGKEVAEQAWSQSRINALMVNEALQGARVVRLKSGDPAIFARSAEEIAAARTAGLEVEIIPGITAASAAAASLGHPLTTRDLAQRLVIATATDSGDAVVPHAIPPGTTLALYMMGRKAGEIEAALLAQGLAPETPVEIVARASQAEEHVLRTRLQGMAAAMRADSRISAPCILLVTHAAAASKPALTKTVKALLPA